MNKLLLFLMLVLCVSLVSALEPGNYKSFEVDTVGDVRIRVMNHSHIISTADCTIDLYNTSNDLVVDEGSMSYETRYYNYSYLFNSVGVWFAEYTCNNTANNELTLYAEDLLIINNTIDKIYEKIESVNQSLTDKISNINSSIHNKISDSEGNIKTNTTQELDFIESLVNGVNTSLYDRIDYVHDNLNNNLYNNFSNTNNIINTANVSIQSRFDTLDTSFVSTNDNLTAVNLNTQGILVSLGYYSMLSEWAWEQFDNRTLTDPNSYKANLENVSTQNNISVVINELDYAKNNITNELNLANNSIHVRLDNIDNNFSALGNKTDIAQEVWEYNVSSVTTTDSAASKLNDVYDKVQNIAQDVWTYSTRVLTTLRILHR